MHKKFANIDTPAAVINVQRMQNNIERMQSRMNKLGVNFRPHVKTSKSMPVVQAQINAGAKGITVSTLKEARYFFEQGVRDILYAVGISGNKLEQVLELRRKGCELKIITDSPETAANIVSFGKNVDEIFEVLIEIDTDGHRSGIRPDQDELLLATARTLHDGGMHVAGVLTHAGSSYDLNTPEALKAMAEQERSGCVRAAECIRAAGMPCPIVSVGSTPTALSAEHLEGVTEVRAGVYVFFDLVMRNTGVCQLEDIALTVLTRVIGHQKEKAWAIVDAGWMAMSRDQGAKRFGYGIVASAGEQLLPYIMSSANQEHGIISYTGEGSIDIVKALPLGTLLRIYPNHACATGAQFPEYQAIGDGIEVWQRIYGW